MGRVTIHLLLLVLFACLGVGSICVAGSEDRACLSQCHGHEHDVVIDGKPAVRVDLAMLRASIHADLSCIDCHQSITTVPHNEVNEPVQCVNCHYKGNPRQAPSNGQERDYIESVHGQIDLDDGKKRPSCSDCHGTHDILAPDQSLSRVHRTHTAETCGQCHEQEHTDYEASIHGKALLWDGILESPSCVDCHGVHRILSPDDPRSSVYPTHVSQTCASCHEAVEVVGKYGVSTKRVVSYDQSYHGLANKYGTKSVANCASCHGVHDILPSSDPASWIHPTNLAQTCGQENCHPNAIEAFSTGQIHLGVVPTPHDVVRWVEIAYILLIILVVGGMIVHNMFDYISGRRRSHGA